MGTARTMTSLISALSWIPRGAALQHPRKYVVDDAEMERIGQLAQLKLDDAKMELELAQEEEGRDRDDEDAWEDEGSSRHSSQEPDASMDEDEAAVKTATEAAERIKGQANGGAGDDDEDDEIVKRYGLENYDDEESKGAAMGAFSNVKGLAYYGNAEQDPYVTLEGNAQDDADEREELEVLPTDNLLVVARTEDDVSQLEVHVYDESQENLYVHHDLLLPAMPLCLEWLDFCPGKSSEASEKGNYVAVGTMDPDIELWSLDVVDGIFPDAILGADPNGRASNPADALAAQADAVADGASGAGEKKKKKKKKAKKAAPTSAHHTDAVLGLSWNRAHRNLLASASADKTVKIWDLSLPPAAPALRSFDAVHADKVQAIQWNQVEPTVLLTGSWDGTVKVFDSRAPDSGVGTRVGADVECLRWDPFDPATFCVSMENGLVQAFDSRNLSSSADSAPAKALWTLSAHDGSVSSLDINPLIPGFIVTGGTDNIVKLWNVRQEETKRDISLVTSRDLGVGKVFCTTFCPNDATTIAVAGSKANMQIWDTVTNAGVREAFGERLKAVGKDIKSRGGSGIVGLVDDDDDDSAGEDDDE